MREEIKLVTEAEVAPGAEAEISYGPDFPFGVRSFSIDTELAPHVEVLGIRVGDVEQMVGDPVPGVLFAGLQDDWGRVSFDPVSAGSPLVVRLRNTSAEPRRLGITIVGIDRAELQRRLEKFLPFPLPLRPLSSKLVNKDLEIYPVDVVPPGVTVTSQIVTQEIFRADALLIDRPHLFRVLEVRVGVLPQFRTDDFEKRGVITQLGIPATVLRDLARAGVALRIDTAQVAQTISVEVKNVSNEPAPLSGRFAGVSVSCEPSEPAGFPGVAGPVGPACGPGPVGPRGVGVSVGMTGSACSPTGPVDSGSDRSAGANGPAGPSCVGAGGVAK